MRTLLRPACPARGAIWTYPNRARSTALTTIRALALNGSRFPCARLFVGVLFRLISVGRATLHMPDRTADSASALLAYRSTH
jgi:hypothetical protein